MQSHLYYIYYVNNLNWHKAKIEELELLQKTSVNNDVFANNYSAVNSILYAKAGQWKDYPEFMPRFHRSARFR